jgi:hypothetical protein
MFYVINIAYLVDNRKKFAIIAYYYFNNMITTKKPVNYLNNKDILKEIHLSKSSFCAFENPEYHQYDLIIDYDDNKNLENSLEYVCRPDTILRARESRATRLNSEKDNKEKILPEDIPGSDLVFRVMTWDHIPIAPKQPRKTVKKKSAKDILDLEEESVEDLFADLDDIVPIVEIDDMVHVRVNFPPFQHFKFDENNNLICVGKSHWKGDITNGEFDKDHGKITNKLAKMYLMLCEKYALRFNWRGYTYVDEMKGSAILQLTYVGLRFNEAKSQNPFAYYTAAINNSFCRVLNTEKRNQNIRDDILEMNNLNPSWSRQFNADYSGSDE